MPSKTKQKVLSVEALRHSEYYGMQEVFDELYAKSKSGESFEDLMTPILSERNIILAYRNIKANKGSSTPGSDGITIEDLGNLTPDDMVSKVRKIVTGRNGYHPKPVRRKEIPKPNGKTRPLGIPCMWDRLIQQCIRQIMEPICEAKFSNNSYGFRPQRSVENAMSAAYNRLQLSKMTQVIEFDIEGFFDNVNHTKLFRQIWAFGIHDKHLIWILKQIVKAPIKMQDGTIEYPQKGTPQGGIISPLLANIVLNELDRWIESQWENNPIVLKYQIDRGKKGIDKGHAYRAMRNTNLKEMYIVRYADDFRIFCRSRKDAEKVLIATTQWIKKRLKLTVSKEKTRIVNAKKKYMEFLGFKIRLNPKADKYTVTSYITDKAKNRITTMLKNQAKNIVHPSKPEEEMREITLYNSMVRGIQNYYDIATGISVDCKGMNRAVMTVLTNRLRKQNRSRLVRKGRPLTKAEKERYGNSQMIRYVSGCEEPIYPIGLIKHRNPMGKDRKANLYTVEGRSKIHQNLKVNPKLMKQLVKQPIRNRSVEYADNRISHFSAQYGRCSVTGIEFIRIEDIHCHHKIPRSMGGTDKYDNLILVLEPVHKLIHATNTETIKYYLSILNLSKTQKQKLNTLRVTAGNQAI